MSCLSCFTDLTGLSFSRSSNKKQPLVSSVARRISLTNAYFVLTVNKYLFFSWFFFFSRSNFYDACNCFHRKYENVIWHVILRSKMMSPFLTLKMHDIWHFPKFFLLSCFYCFCFKFVFFGSLCFLHMYYTIVFFLYRKEIWWESMDFVPTPFLLFAKNCFTFLFCQPHTIWVDYNYT